MPTARELLDQADALMRRNRRRGKYSTGDVPTLTDALDAGRDVVLAPTLILPPLEAAADPIGVGGARESDAGANADPMPLDTLADVPVLTDAVLDWPRENRTAFEHFTANALAGPQIVAEFPDDAGDAEADVDRVVAEPAAPDARTESAADAILAEAVVPDDVVERAVDAILAEAAATDALAAPVAGRDARDAGDAFPASAAEAEAVASAFPPPAVLEREAEDATGPAEAEVADAKEAAHRDPGSSMAVVPRVPFLDDDFILEIPPPDERSTADVPPPAARVTDPRTVCAGTREWDALAEEIRMQVLQRLDIFTDAGLREQLGARLSPIVERASAQLIETINRELGELVRGYVAEAIEREIASWRNPNPTPK
jgi:hypothetical protein